MTNHAKFSPSAASRWLYCTKSLVLPQKPYRFSEFANRGSSLHLRAEKILLGKKEIKDTYKRYTANEEDKEAIQMYVDYVKSVEATHVFVEKQVTIFPDCWGTVDYLAYNEPTKTLHVIDLKAGKGIQVFIKNNKQLMIYSIGAINFLSTQNLKVEKVNMTIVQPEFGIVTQEIDRKNLKELRTAIKDTIEKVKKGDTVFSPSETACRWCNVEDCPKLQEIATKACEADFNSVCLSEKMDMIEPLKIFIKKVESNVYTALDVGEEVEGYRLKATAGRRYFKDEVEAVKFLRKNKILKKDVYEVAKMKSVAQIEKTVKKKKINIDLTDLIEKRSSGFKIAKK